MAEAGVTVTVMFWVIPPLGDRELDPPPPPQEMNTVPIDSNSRALIQAAILLNIIQLLRRYRCFDSGTRKKDTKRGKASGIFDPR